MSYRIKRVLEVLALALIAGVLLFFIVRSWKNAHSPTAEAGTDVAGEELSAIVAVTCNNGRETLEFHRDESGQWRWTDEDFPLDGSKVEELAGALSRFSPTETAAVGESVDLESYGLDFPSCTAAYTTAGGETVSFCFGSMKDGGEYYYMKYAEDDGTVYLAGSYLVDKVRRGLYEMCLPESFPTLSQENVSSLTFERGGSSVTYRSREAVDTLRWYCGSEDVTEDEAFLAAMEELSSLAFDGCVVWEPASESLKICGLKDPAVKITVEYNDATGHACTLTLSIGNQRDEESYFTSWSVSPAVYALRQDAVKALLALAPADSE